MATSSLEKSQKLIPVQFFNIVGMNFYNRTFAMASLLVVLPIDTENPYRLSNCLYR